MTAIEPYGHFPEEPDLITRFCWSPDGNLICSPNLDGALRIWDVRGRRLAGNPKFLPRIPSSQAGEQSDRSIWKVAWTQTTDCRGHPPMIAVASQSPDIYLYNASRPEEIDLAFRLQGHQGPVYSLAWSKDGKYLASGGWDRIIRIWGYDRKDHYLDREGWSSHKVLPHEPFLPHLEGINTLAWNLAADYGNRYLVSGSQDGSVRIWDVHEERPLDVRFKIHGGGVNSVSCSPDGSMIAAAAGNGRIYIHAFDRLETINIIEGHTKSVLRVDFSSDGRLLTSKSADGSVRIWDTRSWLELNRILEPPAHTPRDWHAGLSFHPLAPRLATLGKQDKAIRLWDINVAELLASNPTTGVKYISAKVVLVGKTDVGKSCLAMRLTEDRYPGDTEVGSTPGMRFWHANSLDGGAPASEEAEERSITFWDFGGQERYQLVHQLFLGDASLALVLIDPSRDEEMADLARKWDVILRKHLGDNAVKLLVGTKQDQHNPVVDRNSLQHLCETCRYDGYLEVSAKTGRGIAELREAINARIPWSLLPVTVQPELFQAIRKVISDSRTSGKSILPLIELRAVIAAAHPAQYEPEAVDIVVRQLCEQGLIARTSVAKGDEFLVLQVPEIERYAASLITAAHQNPKGVPAIEERDLGLPAPLLPGITDTERLPEREERIVLECVAELMVQKNICFHHQGLLVFPTLFRPTDFEDRPPSEDSSRVYYDFSGDIDNIYAALVAKLILSEAFGSYRLWRNRVEFDRPDEDICGISRTEHSRSKGFSRLDLYFGSDTATDRKNLFESFIEEHLLTHGVDVQEYQEIKCRHCGERISADAVQINIKSGNTDVICSYCRKTTTITEAISGKVDKRYRETERLMALKGKIDASAAKTAQSVKAIATKPPDVHQPAWLLHLSDLHFSADVDSDPATKLEWLLRDLRTDGGDDYPKINSLEYLVISGDFTDKGCTEGFDKARQFINRLSNEMGLSPERVILVPGNHDVTDRNDSYRLEVNGETVRKLNTEDVVQEGSICLVRDIKNYPKRLTLFDKMLFHKYMVKQYPLEDAKQGIPYYFPDRGVQFLSFNSAWRIDHLHRKRSGLNPAAVAHCLREADSQLGSGATPLRCMVLHHAITGPDMMRNVDVVANLQLAGTKICLHGDVHELRAELIGYLHPDIMMNVIGVGSFGAPFSALPSATPRLYNLLELSPSLDRVRVYVRQQTRENSPWAGVNLWRDSDKSGYHPYFDIRINNL